MNPVAPLDAAMLTADVVSNPLNIGAVLVLRPPPHAGDSYVDGLYQQMITTDLALDPRLRRYPYRDAKFGGMWTWRDAPDVDVSRHCHRHTLTTSDRNSFWQLISRWHSTPIDRSRPMWSCYLVDGLDDGRFAVFLKVHHTLFDGVAGLQMITGALSTDPRQDSVPGFFVQQPAAATPPVHGNPGLPNPLRTARSLVKAAFSGLAFGEQLATGATADFVTGLLRDTRVAPLGAPFTRFNGRLGSDRSVAAGTWPKDRIEAMQRTAGVTANDVVIATVAGVLRRWLLDQGELPKRSLAAFCPITVRSRQAQADWQANRFGGWICPMGTDLEDPAARLELIHRSMREGKQQVARRGSTLSMALLSTSIAPTVLLPFAPLVAKARTGYNLPISSVPGPRREMYWNGAHLEELYPVSAVFDGQGLNVTTCSYANRVGIGYVAGSNMIPDIETLIPLTDESLAELEKALGVTTT